MSNITRPKFGVPTTLTVRRRIDSDKSTIVYSQYISAEGAPVSSPLLAAYYIKVYDVSAMSQTRLKYETGSLSRGGDYWCHGVINPDYIASQLSLASYLLKLEILNKRSSSQMQVGFASLINKAHNVLYIDLICAKVADRLLTSAELGRGNAGQLLLKQVVAFAEQPKFGFKEIKLSALPNVIGFYDKFGFRLDAPSFIADDIMDNLRKFRFRSLNEFDMAYLVSKIIHQVQPEDEAGRPLSPSQQLLLGEQITRVVKTYPSKEHANLWKIIDSVYEKATADPDHARLLYTTISKLDDNGLAPNGINNGISMIYTIPPNQVAGSASKRTTHRRHVTRKRSSVRLQATRPRKSASRRRR